MADDKTYESQEWRQALAKAVKERVDAYSKEMLALRQRELRKNQAVPAEVELAATGATPEETVNTDGNGGDLCPLCGCEDAPGQCKCLGGSITMKNELCPPPEGTPGQAPSMGKADSCKDCGKSHLDKCSIDEAKVAKQELPAKAKEPVKAAEGGNGIKVKSLAKVALPAAPKQAAQHGMIEGSKAAAGGAPAAAPKVKLPSVAQHNDRASSFSDFMPPAGTAHLKSPSPVGAPVAAKPMAAKLPGAGAAKAPAAAPVAKPAPAPKAAAPAPTAKSNPETNDLRKSLGSCALCHKAEHPGSC
jgi:hypothetical protein